MKSALFAVVLTNVVVSSQKYVRKVPERSRNLRTGKREAAFELSSPAEDAVMQIFLPAKTILEQDVELEWQLVGYMFSYSFCCRRSYL